MKSYIYNDKNNTDIKFSQSQNISVSVIIPVYNNEHIFKAVKSAYDQVNIIKEVIVIDDASTIDILSTLEEYKNRDDFTYIKNIKNQGVAISRNIGVKSARGDYIAYLDSDDLWDKNKLRKQLDKALEKNADIVCTGREIINENGITTGRIIHVKNEISYKNLLKHNSISCSSVLLKRKVALEYPMHDAHFHEDFINWLEITKSNRIIYGIDEPLLKYRLSPNGKSRNKLKSAYMTYMSYKMTGIINSKALMYTILHLVNGVIKYYKLHK